MSLPAQFYLSPDIGCQDADIRREMHQAVPVAWG